MTGPFNASTSVHPFVLPSPSAIGKVAIVATASISATSSTSSFVGRRIDSSHTSAATMTSTNSQGSVATTSYASTTSAAFTPVSQNSLILAAPLSTTVNDATGSAIPGFVPWSFTASGSSPSATTSSDDTSSSPISQPAVISIAVVGAAVAAVAISLLFWALRRRRRALNQGCRLETPPPSPLTHSTAQTPEYPDIQIEIKPHHQTHMSSRSRSIPAPIPIYNSHFLDEKEVFTPNANAISPSIYEASPALLSPRRPTYPLLSPIVPISPIAQTPRRSRSFNDAGSSFQLQLSSPMFSDGRSGFPSPLPPSATFTDDVWTEQTQPTLPGSYTSISTTTPQLPPVELPTDRSSRYDSTALALKRSATARSDASSKYSRASRMTTASGIGYGVGVEPMPTAKVAVNKSSTESWGTLSIQSILDLMRGGKETSGQEAGGGMV